MRWIFGALLILSGCDSFKNIPCGQCEKYGAVCNPATKTCQRITLDLSVVVAADMTPLPVAADLSTDDGASPPMCTPATVLADCADVAKPVCGAGGSCRACASTADDPVCQQRSPSTPHCAVGGSKMGQCVACTPPTQATDCGGNTPICGGDGVCRKCQAHADCPSLGMWPGAAPTAIPGVCIFDGASAGSCAPANMVAYVDNNNSAVSTCKGNGAVHDGTTPAKAYCDLQDAIIATKPFIVVNGHGASFAYGDPTSGGTSVSIGRAVTIVGPGGTAATRALISNTSNASACVNVTGTGTGNAIVDGFEIGLASGPGLACGAGTSVIARNNFIHSATGGGVSAANCTITLSGNSIQNNAGGGISATNSPITADANDIESNSGGGVTLNGSKYTVTNNVIGGNSSNSGFGVLLVSSPAGSVFAFNTVAGNAQGGATPAPSGINCVAAATIQDSIVVGNTAPAGTQFGGTCTLSHVVTGPDSAPGATMLVPAFTPTYRLDISTMIKEQKNRACCIDQLAAPGTPNADHDVDFTARPKGAGAMPYDIGAHEAE